jgi:hypothetical protein
MMLPMMAGAALLGLLRDITISGRRAAPEGCGALLVGGGTGGGVPDIGPALAPGCGGIHIV